MKGNPGGRIGTTIRIGKIDIQSGDLIVGDSDGVVVVPASLLSSVLQKAKERQSKEADIVRRCYLGETTLDLFGFPKE